MRAPESTESPHPRRSSVRVLALAPLAVVAVLAVVLVTVLAVRDTGPGEEDARDVVEDYLAARTADGCAHLRFHSEERSKEDPSLEECQEQEDYEEGEYFEYRVTEVRVDGDQAEVDVEDHSDAPSGPFTVDLVAEDDQWRVHGIERHE